LAVVAMTAVDEHRFLEELVSNGSAGTATGDSPWQGLVNC
jgi:hypothetical protein